MTAESEADPVSAGVEHKKVEVETRKHKSVNPLALLNVEMF